MGSCLTKKASPLITDHSTDSKSDQVTEPEQSIVEKTTQIEESKNQEEAKKGIFVIEHHDKNTTLDHIVNEATLRNNNNDCSGDTNKNTIVRTSSCSKEEIDAILIQCGRLSRSNSPARKYSGSKSFDHDDSADCDSTSKDDERKDHRQRRRRTPSRERDQSRSGSGRRVSRSPVKRSESRNSNIINRRSKMVSVPATVTSLAMDKSNNPEQQRNRNSNTTGVKRTSVKKCDGGTVSGSRTVASSRAESPAKGNQQPSLSRSNSRKGEHSPYRRNPLSEIDTNSLALPNKTMLKPNLEKNDKMDTQSSTNPKPGRGTPKKKANPNRRVDEQPPITRTRSSRLSRDLDINPESLLNPQPSSYTTRLLEDIQSFHQKNNTNPSFSLPECVTKACSIVEAVADLNSNRNNPEANIVFSKDPIVVESEVNVGSDDLMEPSFHKYVTMEVDEELECSGSNSFVDSTDRWTSSRSNTRDVINVNEKNRTGFISKRKESSLDRGIVRSKDR